MTSPAKLRATARRLDRFNNKIASVLVAMRRGEALYLEHRFFGRAWCLSGGQYVEDEVARVVIRDNHVVGVGDALFGNCPSQTWRWVE
jgi:hypothetical protein